MRVFELTSRELRDALFESRVELAPLLRRQLIVIREQDFDRSTFGQFGGLMSTICPLWT